MLIMLCGRKQSKLRSWVAEARCQIGLDVWKICEEAFIFIRPFAKDGRPPFDPGHDRHLVTFHTYTLHPNTTSWILLHCRDT